MATVKPGFSERLYEFCVNYELVATAGALIAGYLPGVPSPQDEAKLGWDAKVQMPLFGQTFLLQYKIARHTTERAGANGKFWDVYGSEYWRFSLHKDANGAFTQHELLLDADGFGVQALYCAPLMVSRGELVDAVRDSTVMQQSALIPIGPLGPAGTGGPHSVSFPSDEVFGQPTLHSRPRRGERVDWDQLRRSGFAGRRELDEQTFERLSNTILERRPRRRRREREIEAEDSRARSFLRASAVALDEIGATLVVVPSDSGQH